MISKFKKAIFLFALVFLVSWVENQVLAQNCLQPVGLSKNTEFIYQVTDRGRNQGTLRNKVLQQSLGPDGAYTTTFKSTRISNKKRPESAEEFLIKCLRDTLYLDARLLMREQVLNAFGGKEYELESEDLAYPHEMAIGQRLPDGSLAVKVRANNPNMSNMNMVAKNRKVEGKQVLETPAGSFDVYRITYQYVITLNNMGMNLNDVYNVEEFYSTEHGIVKLQFYTRKGKKAKGIELISKKNPVQALQK